MFRQYLTKFIAVILSISLLSVPVFADMNSYLTDTLTNMKALSYHAYSGQQRGYFVGGSARFKPPSTTIQPFSVTAPKITNNGCGGIDVIMGGFSYLNFQYLVKKLQAILQAAPAFAFQLALKTFLPQVSTILSDLESIADSINGLNVNSCAAAKQLVAVAGGALGKGINNSKLVNASARMQASGQNGFYGGALAQAGSNLGSAWHTFLSDMKSSFTTQNTGSGTGGSTSTQKDLALGVPCEGIIKAVNDAYSVSTSFGTGDFTEFVRTIAGDIAPTENCTPGGGPYQKVEYILPATTNMGKLLSTMAIGNGNGTNGTMQLCSSVAKLRQDTCTSKLVTPISVKVKTTIQAIEASIASGGAALTYSQIALINASDIPIFAFLKAAALSNVPGFYDAMNEKLVEAVSYEIAYHALKALMMDTYKETNLARSQIKHGKAGAAEAEISEAEKSLQTELNFQYRSLEQTYSMKIKKYQSIIGNFYDQYKNVEGALNQVISHSSIGNSYKLQKMLGKS